jgi:hypothetical protein
MLSIHVPSIQSLRSFRSDAATLNIDLWSAYVVLSSSEFKNVHISTIFIILAASLNFSKAF